MSNTCTIRIFYPRTSGRMVLRTDQDWDRDVEPAQTGDDGTRSDFSVTTDQPYVYFKPCLVDDKGAHWSVGSNYLAVTTTGETRDVYPHFFSGTSGAITDPIDVPGAAPGESAHKIRVYQPPGYAENTLKRYPVLYMHDGTNLFFPDEAFMGQTWEVQQTMDQLDDMNVINKAIVVGVYAGDRMNEYTLPGYEAYGRFLAETLKPFVDEGFRTLGDKGNTAVMGLSLGGVVSFYMGLQYSSVFGYAGCLSSTFGYKDDFFARVKSEPLAGVCYYLDSGGPGDNFEATESMRDLMVQRGYTMGGDLLYLTFPGMKHNERYWAMRSHIPFQFFFGKTPRF